MTTETFAGFGVLRGIFSSRATWVVLAECAHYMLRFICNN